MSKKTRVTYTQEQKDKVLELLNQGHLTQNQIEAETGVAKGTIAKMSAELKKGNSVRSSKQTAHPFQTELNAIRARKKEVDDLLNGKLRLELEDLTRKEEALMTLIDLYQQ